MKKVNCGLKMELIGMTLVLASSVWVLFFKDVSVSLLLDSSFYRVEEKLNALWYTLSDIYSHSDVNRSGVYVSVDFKNLVDSWKEWREGQELIRSQIQLFSGVGAFGFVSGSLLMILGKYIQAISK